MLQIIYIINHAADSYVFLDPDFFGLIESIADQCQNVKGWVVMTSSELMPETDVSNVLCYETLVEENSDKFCWPELDEDSACALCYTSGTTGNPKGVLYSHRSTVLHTYGALMPDALNISSSDLDSKSIGALSTII